ncbi:guanylate-binding protein [Acrasis kona]|uniref:Guanylate-binding protein n=1 Tax=Acrasis kona TaxID=1008807 RepID=A0AAW2ZIZ9_9EUKA
MNTYKAVDPQTMEGAALNAIPIENLYVGKKAVKPLQINNETYFVVSKNAETSAGQYNAYLQQMVRKLREEKDKMEEEQDLIVVGSQKLVLHQEQKFNLEKNGYEKQIQDLLKVTEQQINKIDQVIQRNDELRLEVDELKAENVQIKLRLEREEEFTSRIQSLLLPLKESGCTH